MKKLLIKLLTFCFAVALVLSVFTGCGQPEYYTENLTYELIDGGRSFSVKGIGTATDTEIVIPSTYGGKPVTAISERAFEYEKNIMSVKIPSSVTEIGEWSFYYCSSMVSVEIANGVTDINEGAFFGCSALTSVTLPASVKNIGSIAFANCSNLENIQVSNGNPNFTSIDGNVYSKDGKVLVQYANGKKQDSFTLPNSVRVIGISAFRSCDNLKSVQASSVTEVGPCAFYECASLESVTISNSATKIGYCAFYNCKRLSTFSIPNTVTSIGLSAFYNCISLSNFSLPNSVTSIGSYVFYGCDSFEYYTDGGLKYLGNSENNYLYLAGVESTSITSVTVNQNCKFIGDGVFRSCYSLETVNLPNNLMGIGSDAFYECNSLSSINIPDGVTSIGSYAFYNCNSLPSIALPNSLNKIDDGVFSGCRSLAYNVKDGMKYLGNSVNNYLYLADVINTNITTVTIEENCKFIGTSAFAYCSKLRSVVIPSSVISIGSSAFDQCETLQTINYKGSKSDWDSIDMDRARRDNNKYLLDATIVYDYQP